jgi:hypothetical protein
VSDELKILNNPWANVYWFARMLISLDKYGGVGKDSRMLATLASAVRSVVQTNRELQENQLVELLNTTIRNILTARYKNVRSKRETVELLCNDLQQKLLSPQDFEVFVLTCESIMIPINEALPSVPSDDREFAQAVAKSHLEALGEGALPTVINIWDDLGLYGCLNAERAQVVRVFGELRKLLADKDLDSTDSALVLTALVQEFERRLGQKRKGRAGRGLEDVTGFLLDHFEIPTTQQPEHFQADIEVDKWVKVKKGWLIGISCKRTLRERWKQVSSADYGILGKFKIMNIWHVVTYDEDLSDEKLGLLGSLRHIFYLRDESRRYKDAHKNPGLEKYVRPMSSFIQDLRQARGTVP